MKYNIPFERLWIDLVFAWLIEYPKIYFNYKIVFVFTPFHATSLFLYPLKTSENERFSDVFREYRKRPVAWKGLPCHILKWAVYFFARVEEWLKSWSCYRKFNRNCLNNIILYYNKLIQNLFEQFVFIYDTRQYSEN